MATISDDLKDYLAKSEKPSLSTKLQQSISNVIPPKLNWLNGVHYSRVPTQEDATSNGSSSGWFSMGSNTPESSCCPALSRIQRIIAFTICISLGLVFFTFAGLLTPFLLLKARKFSLLFTLGSLFMMFSFSFLWGPVNHLKHLFSKERFFFTSSYFGTLFLTLYFAMVIQSTPFTVLFAILQVVALVWFLVSYIPGGHTGLRFFSKLSSSAVTNSLPV